MASIEISPIQVKKIGKALIGKSVGDGIIVKTPGGMREFEIVGICIER
ncbi:MAG: hypothetical protein FJ139_08115 [Deltaproteobacteria bacterium]|nr:hypothetical protein [Deltaproteobacteria bacterium]